MEKQSRNETWVFFLLCGLMGYLFFWPTDFMVKRVSFNTFGNMIFEEKGFPFGAWFFPGKVKFKDTSLEIINEGTSKETITKIPYEKILKVQLKSTWTGWGLEINVKDGVFGKKYNFKIPSDEFGTDIIRPLERIKDVNGAVILELDRKKHS